MEQHYFAIFTRGVSYVKPSLDDVLDFVNDYAVIGLKHAFRRYGILSLSGIHMLILDLQNATSFIKSY